MKPKNKLGGKLDKLKNQVAYESSKKVSDIQRVKKENESVELEELREELRDMTAKAVKAEMESKVMEQVLDNERKAHIEQIRKKQDRIIELQNKVTKYEKGLTFYAEAGHVDKGAFGHRVVDKGEVAKEALGDQ